ncbi:MAG: hypothetical protein ACKVU1_12180 [bacterium]
MRHIMTATLLALTLALAPSAARGSDPHSDIGFRGWGPRVGLTFDPDQFHFGAHMDFGNFAKHVRFQPNIEVGLGDDITLVAINFEAAYRFRESWDVWSPYLGGGIGANIVSYDSNGLGDDSSTDLGVNVLGGIEKGLSSGDRFFLEAKLGLVDESPDVKLTAGWTFYH